MDAISPLKRRSQRGMIDFIKNKDCQWLACTFRVNPTNRTYFSPSESKKHTLQTVKWTIGFVKNEFNSGKNLIFLPFWGGEVSTGVAKHIHALLEMPANKNDDFEGKTQVKMNALAKKAFRSSVSTAFYIEEVSKSEHALQLFGDYCMRWEGKQFGSGTDKLITEIAYLQN